MGKIIDAIKQFREVVSLRAENLELYDEKQYLEVELEESKKELEEKKKEFEFKQNECKHYDVIIKKMQKLLSENQNGSVINLQNKIRRLLEEEKT